MVSVIDCDESNAGGVFLLIEYNRCVLKRSDDSLCESTLQLFPHVFKVYIDTHMQVQRIVYYLKVFIVILRLKYTTSRFLTPKTNKSYFEHLFFFHSTTVSLLLLLVVMMVLLLYDYMLEI